MPEGGRIADLHGVRRPCGRALRRYLTASPGLNLFLDGISDGRTSSPRRDLGALGDPVPPIVELLRRAVSARHRRALCIRQPQCRSPEGWAGRLVRGVGIRRASTTQAEPFEQIVIGVDSFERTWKSRLDSLDRY